MNKVFIKKALIFGVLLWLTGYVLGILLFPIIPVRLIGWVISPIGVVITLYILFNKIHYTTLTPYIYLAILWTLIAILCDYFLLVRLFKPDDGYYKLDVYLYYILTFLLPLIVGIRKSNT